ncbi:tRNA pseudouridine(55) synthase TruB [Marisediminicola senii]|uniref:tRNA pseudouridine(55) synthase TruB n=1 Tax=Marisediminicola senii TaxID=2711233 RepID=UPI0013EBFE75|nr:tRNA pseudouridine(55) synthase TruB [Marisediminicola senii]
MNSAAARTTDTTSGILLVDKPEGFTSHDVVARTRRLAGTRKVGHAGTLDPMATGLLVLGLNSSTRLLTYLVGLDKEYIATIRLGESTASDDREGDTVEVAPPGTVRGIDPARIAEGIASLSGVIEQVPSSVSAIKVDGKRAYALVRAGETVELASRTVTVSAFELLGSDEVAIDGPDGLTRDYLDLRVRIECSSGTYIRALARDLGAALGVGGHLTALRRSRVGPFSVMDAAPLDTLDPRATLLAPAAVAATLFPTVTLAPEQVVDLTNGKRVALPDAADGEPIAALAPDGRLVGLIRVSSGTAKSIINFPTDEVLA